IQTQKSISNVLTSIATNAQLDTTQLTQAIQNINNVNKLNSMLNDKLGFVKQNIPIGSQNLISNVELTLENNSGIIAIQGSIQLTNGQTISIQKTNTTLKVVNFNQPTFNTYIKTHVNQSSQLNSTNIKSTIISSSSGLDNTNLKSANATAHQTPTLDPDSNNSYFQYDFTFNLQDGYCFYDNPSSITDTKTLNNVFTGIIHNATISNVDRVINQIKQNASSISNLNTLLTNQQKIEEIVKNANIVSDNNLIDTVKLTDVTTESDTNVTLQLIVTLKTGQEAINKEIPTNIKIVKINQDSLKQYFKQSVTTKSMIDNSNLINTLYSSNGSGIINNCLANTTSIASTKYIYQNLPGTNIPYYKYNLTLNLNDGYCFYDFSNKKLTSTQTITEVLSGIKYDINPNSATLVTKLNSINSYSQLLQYSKNTSNSLLKLVKGTIGYVDKDYWVRCVENITLTNVSDKVNISFDVKFSTDKVVNVSATTNVTILTFNNSTFTTAVGKVNTETDLNNSAKLKKLIESSLSVTRSGTVSTATSERLSNYYNDTVTRLNYYKYNFAFTLDDQYCFFNNNNRTISNKKNLNSGYKTKIIVPNSIDSQFNKLIDKLTNMTLEDGTNCFTNICDGTNYSEPSTWRFKNDIVYTITGLDKSVFKSISIQNAGLDPSNGMIKFRISAVLNAPYQYKGSNTINQEVLTKTYDPNSEYNKSLFIFDGASCIRGVSGVYTSKHPQTLYFPKSCTSINGPNRSGFEGNVVSSKLDFRFSKIANIISGSTFRNNSSIVNITFNGNKNFLFNGGNTNKYNFADMRNLESIDLSNTLITNIPEGTFQNNSKLSTVRLSGCQYLSDIYENAFLNCSALTELDFSSHTLISVGQNAFKGCTALRKIYVKDFNSWSLINTAMQYAGFENVSIQIVGSN
ncbi:MAG: leucine-rich repeat domain-containing protein, partial [Candidatus Ureaplasma intestinipullorum]|nr:leucine-rich repeat domain-containing protein [Candidatus Ureaplasma intestinipullorum]